MATLSTKIDTHDENIKSVITTSNDTLKNAINAKGCVKSIQRGTKVIDRLLIKSSISINISPIDPNKSLLFDVYLGGSGTGTIMNNYRYMTTNLLQASIVITNTSTREYSQTMGSGDITEFALSYQVVEFY